MPKRKSKYTIPSEKRLSRKCLMGHCKRKVYFTDPAILTIETLYCLTHQEWVKCYMDTVPRVTLQQAGKTKGGLYVPKDEKEAKMLIDKQAIIDGRRPLPR